MRYVFLQDFSFTDDNGGSYEAKPGFELIVGPGGAMAYDPKAKGSQRIIRLNEVKVRELEDLLAGGIIRHHRLDAYQAFVGSFPTFGGYLVCAVVGIGIGNTLFRPFLALASAALAFATVAAYNLARGFVRGVRKYVKR